MIQTKFSGNDLLPVFKNMTVQLLIPRLQSLSIHQLYFREMAKDKFLLLVEVCEELMNLEFLQEIFLIIKNSCWNTAHIAAYFGLQNGLNNPSIIAYARYFC
jgi:hypothetical protein